MRGDIALPTEFVMNLCDFVYEKGKYTLGESAYAITERLQVWPKIR